LPGTPGQFEINLSPFAEPLWSDPVLATMGELGVDGARYYVLEFALE